MPSYTEVDSIVTNDGTTKNVADIGTGTAAGNQVVSDPPTGCFYVTNLYVNQDGKVVVKWDDAGGSGFITTVPPVGNYKVINLYVNEQGKVVVKYDDIPA